MSEDLKEKLGEEGVKFIKNNVDQFFDVLELLAKESDSPWDDLALDLIKEKAKAMVKAL